MVQQRRFDEIYDDLVDVWKKMEADTLAFKNLLDELCKANYANNMNQSPQSGLSQSNNFAPSAREERIRTWSPEQIKTTPRIIPKAETMTVPPRSGGSTIGGSRFVKEYNQLPKTGSLVDKQQRDAFAKHYKLKAFSCINHQERVNTPTKAPVFRENDSVAQGDFWAKLINGVLYEVVPNQRITYDETLHYYAGMKEAFVSNFKSGTYNRIVVLEPAQFQNFNGEWRLNKPGRIQLS